jgi:hypothetical protein
MGATIPQAMTKCVETVAALPMLKSRRIARIVSLTALVVCIQSSSAVEKQDYVSVSVLVRDHHGGPVAGLTAQDFIVEEHGQKYRVDYVSVSVVFRNHHGEPVAGLTARDFTVEEDGQNYPVATAWQPSRLRADEQAASSPHSLTLDPRPEAHTAAQLGQTHLLLLLPPNMEAGTRNFMLSSAIKYMGLAHQYGWAVAILDPANRFVAYTADGEKVIRELKHLQKRRDPKTYDARWIDAARLAILDLGALPGRHLVVLGCDTALADSGNDSQSAASVPLNPFLLKVHASMFEGDAKRASAQLYLIQASGPGTVVPFGEAAVGVRTDLSIPVQ